jgi:hypothetical protein
MRAIKLVPLGPLEITVRKKDPIENIVAGTLFPTVISRRT